MAAMKPKTYRCIVCDGVIDPLRAQRALDRGQEPKYDERACGDRYRNRVSYKRKAVK